MLIQEEVDDDQFIDTSLHPSPETMEFHGKGYVWARIEVGQHSDGRWMWSFSWHERWAGGGYCCNPKWGKFAATRESAIESAIREGLENLNSKICQQHKAPEVIDWLLSLQPRQTDMFLQA